MKVSYNWLNEYVEHDLSPQALAEALTLSGLEVEDVASLGHTFDGVVVGRVVETRPHPGADRLTLCQVDLGEGAPVQIVCGAPNVAAGQKVPVATVGATLMLPSRDDPSVRQAVTLRPARLRGETSHGMICAEDELGLGDDHSGILVLEAEADAGQPFADYLRARGLSLHDAVLDVSITPNRPDAVSHLGIARDVAALTGAVVVPPRVDVPEAGGAATEQVRIAIEAPEACPRYVGLVVRGVRIGPSPAWLQQRLVAVGLRPRNNVVDVTNYVMYECGQPLHAFDLDQLAGSAIRVRLTEGEEPFTTLDGKARRLPPGTLLICDAERPVAIAGVMGGENSEVTEATTNVLLESAYFDPSTIRRAAKALGLQTDASYRFERGVDPQGQAWAAARAAQLIAELAGGTVVPGLVDAHPRPATPRTVTLRLPRLRQVLGTEVPTDEVIRLLTAIGFAVHRQEPLEAIVEHVMDGRRLEAEAEEAAVVRTLQCRVPSFRPDVEREIDVIEEVARLWGYDRIAVPAHAPQPARVPRERAADALRRRVQSLLREQGYHEVYTNSLLRRETAERFNQPHLSGCVAAGGVVETLNPISQEMAALRPSLLPGVLQVMGHNRNHGRSALRFFEFGHVFRRSDAGDTTVPGYAEHEALLIALSGPRAPEGWDTPPHDADFFDLKGVVEHLLAALRVPALEQAPVHEATAVTAYHLALAAGSVPFGSVARLADAVAEAYDLDAPVYVAELDWSALSALAAGQLHRAYQPVARYPVAERDLAFVLEAGQPVGPLLEAARRAGGPLLQHLYLFDLYEGDRLEAGRKSIALRLRFGADRTLKDAEVDRQVEAVVRALAQAFGATLRT